MSYLDKQVRKKAGGSIYWQVVIEKNCKDRPPNIPREQPVNRCKIITPGIVETDQFELVKETCKHIKVKLNLDRKSTNTLAKSATRKSQGHFVESPFPPPFNAKEFEAKTLITGLAINVSASMYQRLIFNCMIAQ
jgi:hypothetical protein